MKHECDQMKKANNHHHFDAYPMRPPFNLGHGRAMLKIEFDEEHKVWIGHCDEYGDVIEYCPYCGVKL